MVKNQLRAYCCILAASPMLFGPGWAQALEVQQQPMLRITEAIVATSSYTNPDDADPLPGIESEFWSWAFPGGNQTDGTVVLEPSGNSFYSLEAFMPSRFPAHGRVRKAPSSASPDA